jgi:pyruvate dehydrogenase E1 component beta subunit
MADVRELTYGEAVREAIAEEMRRDPRVFLIGEDRGRGRPSFKTLVGWCRSSAPSGSSTPISEPGHAGIGVGAAMTGMRPIVDVMFRATFNTLTMDQMVNPGRQGAPHVGRQDQGADRLHHRGRRALRRATLAVAARLGEPRPRSGKVALPSGPAEAKGLMATPAIRDDSRW